MYSPTQEELSVLDQFGCILNDIACSHHDLRRDLNTLSRRFHNEGFRFLSVAIPRLGKAFDRALDGLTVFTPPHGFDTMRGTVLPKFLGSVLSQVFESCGSLKKDLDYVLIRKLRTFFYFAYKIQVEFNAAEELKFETKFIETDNDLESVQCGDTPLIRLMALQLSCLNDVKPTKPKFGPGVSSNVKRQDVYTAYLPINHSLALERGVSYYYMRYDPRPYAEIMIYFVTSWLRTMDVSFEDHKFEFEPSKVLFVPKDSRGPRTICCEDSRLMYSQKGLQESLYEYVENSRRFGGRVNFTDQTINQKLTSDKRYATIDLKDASDRVSLHLVTRVFPTQLLERLLNCRSSHALLPSGRVFPMRKFAPMGSALCFPVLALVVYTAACAAIHLAGGPLPGRQTNVFVYGDDIIVPNEYASVVMEALESVGLLINKDKSFVNSRFTESCGRDDLDCHDITPLRCKRFISRPERRRYKGRYVLSDSGFTHGISLYNKSRELGLNNLANSLIERVERYYGTVPYGLPDSPFPCKEDSDFRICNWDLLDERGKLRALSVSDEESKFSHTDHTYLMRFLLNYDGENRCDPSKISLRRPFLQRRPFIEWGTSYATARR